MQLIFIGSGSAFTVDRHNYHSNILLIPTHGNRKLLIDCGTDARRALDALEYTYADISDVYVSHLHSDHAGGLEWLGFTRKFDEQCIKPHLYIADTLCDDLWHKVLSGGMQSLEGERATLSSYFTVHRIKGEQSFIWEDIVFSLVKTQHVFDGTTEVPSFGLFFRLHNHHIFITTDTRFTPYRFADHYEKADLIFHDCETLSRKSGVHAHYEELKTLDPTIKQKMWLYHYGTPPLPDAVADGFKGFVAKGQTFCFHH